MKSLEEIREKIVNKDKIHLILDYDNRITPYIRTSNSYFFSPTFKRIIENLARKEFITVSILTDKNIKNFKTEFPIDTTNVDLYGALGVEVEIQNNKENKADDSLKKELKKIYNALSKTFAENKKLILEYQDWSIIINTKGLSKEDLKPVKKAVKDALNKSKFKENLKLTEEENKLTLHITDFELNSLLEKLISEYQDYSLIYIGKEETTFKFLKKKCDTIKVIQPGDSMESKADLVVFRSKFEEFLSDTNNLYL